MLPIEQTLFVGDSDGKFCKIDTCHLMEGKYSSEILHGSHNTKAKFLVALHGKLNAHGFLSGYDASSTVSKNELTKQDSLYFMRGLTSIPCLLLMSVGVGYQELFTSNVNNDSCFMTWALPNLESL